MPTDEFTERWLDRIERDAMAGAFERAAANAEILRLARALRAACWLDDLIRAAADGAADIERDACARVCEEIGKRIGTQRGEDQGARDQLGSARAAAEECEAEIRARARTEA